jgi:5-methylcytosine-specific restriction protein A
MEGYHLIPLSAHEDFDYSLDVISNIVSLCDTCHACLHHGTKKDKKIILEKLYKLKIKSLKKSGFDITLEKLMSYYGI